MTWYDISMSLFPILFTPKFYFFGIPDFHRKLLSDFSKEDSLLDIYPSVSLSPSHLNAIFILFLPHLSHPFHPQVLLMIFASVFPVSPYQPATSLFTTASSRVIFWKCKLNDISTIYWLPKQFSGFPLTYSWALSAVPTLAQGPFFHAATPALFFHFLMAQCSWPWHAILSSSPHVCTSFLSQLKCHYSNLIPMPLLSSFTLSIHTVHFLHNIHHSRWLYDYFYLYLALTFCSPADCKLWVKAQVSLFHGCSSNHGTQ